MPKINHGRVKAYTGQIYFTLEPNMPVWITPAGLLGEAPGGLPYLFALSGYDSGGEDPKPLSFTLLSGTLPVGLTLASNGQITGIPVNNDITSTFTVRLSDGTNYVDRKFSIQVVNLPPYWVTPAGQVGDLYQSATSIEVGLIARDPDGDDLSYSITSGSLPPGITLDTGTGVLSGVTPLVENKTEYDFVVDANDGHGGVASQQFYIDIIPVVLPPYWVTAAGLLTTVPMGVTVAPIILLAKSNAYSISYSVISGLLPKGLSLDGNTGLVTGTPSNVMTDTTSTFTVLADDGHGQTVPRTFSIMIQHVNLPPIWITPAGSLGQANAI